MSFWSKLPKLFMMKKNFTKFHSKCHFCQNRSIKPTHTKIFIKSSSWGYFLMFLVFLWSFLTIWGHSRLLKVIFRSWSKCYGVVENGLASFYKDRKHENTNKEEFKFALSKIFYFVRIFCKNYFCKIFFQMTLNCHVNSIIKSHLFWNWLLEKLKFF